MLDEKCWEGASDQSISAFRMQSKAMENTVNKETEFKRLMLELTLVYKSRCLLRLIG